MAFGQTGFASFPYPSKGEVSLRVDLHPLSSRFYNITYTYGSSLQMAVSEEGALEFFYKGDKRTHSYSEFFSRARLKADGSLYKTYKMSDLEMNKVDGPTYFSIDKKLDTARLVFFNFGQVQRLDCSLAHR